MALAVSSLAYITIQEYKVLFSPELFAVIFLGAISGYNFIKYARIAGLHHRSLATSLKSIQVFSLLCGGTLVYFLFYIPRSTWVLLLSLSLLTLFYAIPFLKRKSLRTLHGIKLFVVAIVWSGVVVLLPLWDMGIVQLGQTDVICSFVQVFLLVIVWTLPFEIRDLNFDAPSLGTLPQKLGVRGAKILGGVMVLLAILLEGFKDTISPHHFYGLFFIGILSVVLLGISSKKQSRYFASFLIESIPIIWVLLDIALRRLLG